MKKIIIVMPVANEEETMQELIDKIMQLPYDDLLLYPVIDSYSKDRTEEIIRAAEKTYNGRVKCQFFERSKGLVSCYFYGFTQALKDGADYIIEMDGGLSHDPASIPMFISALDQGYDCAWGSRYVKGGELENQPFYRRMLSSGGTFLSNLVLGTKLKDMTSGYEAFKAPVLREMYFSRFLSHGHMYQTEMRFYCRNFKTKEIPIKYIGGGSSLKLKSVTEALRILFKLKQHEKYVWKHTEAKE